MLWSGLDFSYDDLSEERSAVHQLKYAVLKTPIFKKSHHLKIFKFSKSINMVCHGPERVKVLYPITNYFIYVIRTHHLVRCIEVFNSIEEINFLYLTIQLLWVGIKQARALLREVCSRRRAKSSLTTSWNIGSCRLLNLTKVIQNYSFKHH